MMVEQVGGGTTITNTLPPSCNQELPGSKAPRLYAAIPDSSTSVKLYFTDADGPMDQYVLVYGDSSNNYTMGALRMGSQGTRTFTVSELRPFRMYYFRMRAMNGCAPGPWSNEISAKTKLVSNPFTQNQEEVSEETSETIVAKLPSYSKAEQQIIVPKPVNTVNITTNTSALLMLCNILLFMIALLLFFIFFILFYKKRKKKQTQPVNP